MDSNDSTMVQQKYRKCPRLSSSYFPEKVFPAHKGKVQQGRFRIKESKDQTTHCKCLQGKLLLCEQLYIVWRSFCHIPCGPLDQLDTHQKPVRNQPRQVSIKKNKSVVFPDPKLSLLKYYLRTVAMAKLSFTNFVYCE